jgi:hypothetical protein
MIEIKEGPELDRAVAEVIGFRPRDIGYNPSTQDMPCSEYFRGADSGIVSGAVWIWKNEREFDPYRPSVDLNDAFHAAEAVGLFFGCSHILGRGSANEPNGSWWVHHTRDRDDELSEYSQVGSGVTAALAICAAILKVKQT